MAETLAALEGGQPVGVLGTAFSFVHLLDHMEATGKRVILPKGSRAMETGGYKGRSREVAKPQLRRMISQFLGVEESDIVTEYGMSELSSQAYDRSGGFQFPSVGPRAVISPETGCRSARWRNRIASRVRSGEYLVRHGSANGRFGGAARERFRVAGPRSDVRTARLLADAGFEMNLPNYFLGGFAARKPN